MNNDVAKFYTLEQAKIYSTKIVSHFSDFDSISYEFLNQTEPI
jgi:hypothetical protein